MPYLYSIFVPSCVPTFLKIVRSTHGTLSLASPRNALRNVLSLKTQYMVRLRPLRIRPAPVAYRRMHVSQPTSPLLVIKNLPGPIFHLAT